MKNSKDITMDKKLFALSTLAAVILTVPVAQAGDQVLGAVIGAGVGAVIGKNVGGRDGAIVGGAIGAAAGASAARPHHGHRHDGTVNAYVSVGGPGYYAPPPIYYEPVYYAPPPVVVYERRPVYVQPAPVVYYGRDVYYVEKHHRKHHHKRWREWND